MAHNETEYTSLVRSSKSAGGKDRFSKRIRSSRTRSADAHRSSENLYSEDWSSPSSGRQTTDAGAPMIGSIRVTQGEDSKYGIDFSDPSYSIDNGPLKGSRYTSSASRSKSLDRSLLTGRYSAMDWSTSTDSPRMGVLTECPHNDLYVVGYASVTTQARPSDSPGVTYSAHIDGPSSSHTGYTPYTPRGSGIHSSAYGIENEYTPVISSARSTKYGIENDYTPVISGTRSTKYGIENDYTPAISGTRSTRYGIENEYIPGGSGILTTKYGIGNEYTSGGSGKRSTKYGIENEYSPSVTKYRLVDTTTNGTEYKSLPVATIQSLPPPRSKSTHASSRQLYVNTSPSVLNRSVSVPRLDYSDDDLVYRPPVRRPHHSTLSSRSELDVTSVPLDSFDQLEEDYENEQARKQFRAKLQRASRPTSSKYSETESHSMVYSGGDNGIGAEVTHLPVVSLETDRHARHHATHYSLDVDRNFEPNDVRSVILPNGQKAVMYTRASQTGSGDHEAANAEIERIIKRTGHLQESMHTLEDFVQRNRSLFPEDILIFQKIRYYRLSETELTKMGERPDGEIYGVKISEKLVVPYGSDVVALLNRYYSKHQDVEVQYEDVESIRRRVRHVESEGQGHYSQPANRDVIRKQVEAEYEERERSRGPLISHHVDHSSTYHGLEGFHVNTYSSAPSSLHEYYMRRTEANKELIRAQADQSDITLHPRVKFREEHRSDLLDRVQRELSSRGNDVVVSRKETSMTSMSSAPPLPVRTEVVQKKLAPLPEPEPVKKKRCEPLEFTSRLRGRTVTEGNPVRLHCAVSGGADTVITWYHDDNVIKDFNRCIISNTYGLCSLEIHKVSRKDAGTYTVKASSGGRDTSCSARLEVDVLPDAQEPTPRPHFITDVRDVGIDEGERAVFKAQVAGRPMPKVSWQKDGFDLISDSRTEMFNDNAGNVSLTIKDVKSTDSGLYICSAKNKDGKAKSAASLRVMGKSAYSGQYTEREKMRTMMYALPEPSQSGTKVRGTKPVFVTMPPERITVEDGTEFTMRCMVEGDPRPTVKWYKGVRELMYTSRIRVLAEGDGHHMMQIHSVMTSRDAGEYSVEASNVCGTTKVTVMVKIIPKQTQWEGKYKFLDEDEVQTTPLKKMVVYEVRAASPDEPIKSKPSEERHVPVVPQAEKPTHAEPTPVLIPEVESVQHAPAVEAPAPLLAPKEEETTHAAPVVEAMDASPAAPTPAEVVAEKIATEVVESVSAKVEEIQQQKAAETPMTVETVEEVTAVNVDAEVTLTLDAAPAAVSEQADEEETPKPKKSKKKKDHDEEETVTVEEVKEAEVKEEEEKTESVKSKKSKKKKVPTATLR